MRFIVDVAASGLDLSTFYFGRFALAVCLYQERLI